MSEAPFTTLSPSSKAPLRVLVAGGRSVDLKHVAALLRTAGRDVIEAETQQEILAKVSQVHAIVLHCEVINGDGWALLGGLTQDQPTAPVLFVGPSDGVAETLRAFELGADDYASRSTDPAVIAMRVAVALRRYRHDEVLVFSDLSIDLQQRSAYLAGKRLKLTALEFDVLALLATHPMRMWTREELLRTVWTDAEDVMDRTVDVRIRRLRASLGDEAMTPRFIETVRGRGYRWICPPAYGSESN